MTPYETQVVAKALQIVGKQLHLGPVFDSPTAVKDYLCLKLGNLEREVFAVMFLTTQHQLIAYEELFTGSLSQTSVYPRVVVQKALAYNCGAVLLSHNHPSGMCDASRADEHLTMTLKQALALVDVRVLDHIIVSGNRSRSMAETGLL